MSNIFNNWKNYLVLFLLIAVIVTGLIANNYYQQAIKKEALVKAGKILNNPAAPIIDTFRDSGRQNHSEIKADENDIPYQALKDTAAGRKRLIDTIKESLNLADITQIQELTQEILSLKAKIKLIAQIDSNGHKTLNYSDKWLNLSYNPFDSTALVAYDARLTAVNFYKKSWLPFSKQIDFIDFFGDDPRMNVNGVRHFKVIPPDPLFGFYADVKGIYFLSNGKFNAFAGPAIRIQRFTFQVMDYYSKEENGFNHLPAVELNYKFLGK